MPTHIEAVYENGVFRPLQAIHLPEHQRVILTIQESIAANAGIPPSHFVLPVDRWQAFCDALDAPPRNLPRLKKLLNTASLFER